MCHTNSHFLWILLVSLWIRLDSLSEFFSIPSGFLWISSGFPSTCLEWLLSRLEQGYFWITYIWKPLNVNRYGTVHCSHHEVFFASIMHFRVREYERFGSVNSMSLSFNLDCHISRETCRKHVHDLAWMIKLDT